MESTEYGFHGRALESVRKDGQRLHFSPAAVQGLHPAELTSVFSLTPPVIGTLPPAESTYAAGNGNVTLTTLDQAGQAVSEMDAAGPLPRVQRDSNNRVTLGSDGRGNITTYTYDARGNVTRIRDSLAGPGAVPDLFPGQLMPSGTRADSLAIVSADLDSDGILDVAVVGARAGATGAEGRVSVLRGDGLGHFSFTAAFDVGTVFPGTGDRSGYGFLTADLNGDGRPDLVTNHANDDFVTVLLRNAANNGYDRTDFATGDGPDALVAADLTGDGILDLISTNNTTVRGALSILAGIGGGRFAPPQPIPYGETFQTTAAGDVDADGDADLVALPFNSSGGINAPQLFRNNGAGTFAAPVSLSGLLYSLAPEAELRDYDADGDLDLVSLGGTNIHFAIAGNDGAGNFSPLIDDGPGLGSSGYRSLLTDLNADNRFDVVQAAVSSTVTVALQSSDRTFPGFTELTGDATDLTAGDVDGDGDRDLIALNPVGPDLFTAAVQVFFNRGDGNFTNNPRYPVPFNGGSSLGLADVNGDGQLDAVTPQAVLLGNRDASFSAAIPIDPIVGPFGIDVHVADLDGDLDLDLVSRKGGDKVSVYLNDGAGNFPIHAEYILPLAAGTSNLDFATLADFNGDGKPDLLAAGGRKFFVLDGTGQAGVNGNGVFDAVGVRTFDTPGDSQLAVGDFNGDQKLDVVNTFFQFFFGNGAGGFGPAETLFTPPIFNDGTRPVLPLDVEGDGDLDLITPNRMSGIPGSDLALVAVYVQTGLDANNRPIFDITIPPSRFPFDIPSELRAADVDGDGDRDLVFPGGYKNVVVLPNQSNGSFGPASSYASGGQSTVSTADLDRDGDQDLVVGFVGSLTVLLGRGTTANATGDRRFTYDATFNQLTGEIDELGRTTLYTLDPTNGNRLTETRVVGLLDTPQNGQTNDVVTRFTYTPQALVDTVTDPLAHVTDFDYNTLGQVTKITFAKGTPQQAVQQFEYDTAGNQTAFIDENGRRTEFQYDAANRLTRTAQADPDSAAGPLASPVTLFAYDAAGNLVSTTDPLGHVTTFTYDNLNRLLRTTEADPDGAGPLIAPVTTNTYNVAGNLSATTDPRNNATRFVYDARNRLVDAIDAAGGHTRQAYDVDDQLRKLTDANGHVTGFKYDSRGRLVKSTDALDHDSDLKYDAADQLVAVTDRNGHTTRYEYDDLGRLIRTIAPDPDGTGPLAAPVSTLAYDKAGNQTSVTDPLGNVTQYEYDARNRLVRVIQPDPDSGGSLTSPITIFAYDAAGNTISTTDPRGGVTTFEYDALNRAIRTTLPDPDGAGSLLSPVSQTTYDAANNVTSVTDPLGEVTQYAYDGLNRLIRTTQPDPDGAGPLAAPITQFTYDSNGNLTSVIDPLSHATTFAYDVLNRPTTVTDPRAGITASAYDAVGNVLSVRDAVGNTTTYAYDVLNRPVRDTDARGKARQFTYDAVGNLTTGTDRNGRVRQFQHDALNRLTAEKWLDAVSAVVYSFAWTYDAANRMLTASDVKSAYALNYDSLGRTTSVSSSTALGTAALGYTFDAAGNILTARDTVNNVVGATDTTTYDALNRQTQTIQTGIGVSTKRVNFAYNGLNQFTAISRFADAAATQSVANTAYSYDGLHRLTNIAHSNAGGSVNAYAFSYDVASRLTRQTDIDGSADFTFDNTDQLVGADRSGTLADETYGYDLNGNRLTKGQSNYTLGVGNRLLSDGQFNYQYDDEGNLTLRTEIATGRVREYQWDHRNRLTSVTDRNTAGGPATMTAKYTYDAFDRRIAKAVDTNPADAVDAAITHFVYDRANVRLEFVDTDGVGPAAAALANRYLHGPAVDQILAQESSAGSVLYHLADQIGTIRDLIDNTGTLANHIKYDSFGNLLSQTNLAATSRYLFTGRELDDETGQYYYRARYYDSATGRFLSTDPIFQTNLYEYAANNPLQFVDPSGAAIVTGAIVGASAGAVVGAALGCLATLAAGCAPGAAVGAVIGGAVGAGGGAAVAYAIEEPERKISLASANPGLRKIAITKNPPGAPNLIGGSVVSRGSGTLSQEPCPLTSEDSSGILTKGGGNILTKGGGNILTKGGGNILTNGGGNILTKGGAGILAKGGAGILAKGGAGILTKGGGNILTKGGAGLISEDTSGILAKDGTGLISEDSSGILAKGGLGILAKGGSNLVGPGAAGNLVGPGAAGNLKLER